MQLFCSLMASSLSLAPAMAELDEAAPAIGEEVISVMIGQSVEEKVDPGADGVHHAASCSG